MTSVQYASAGVLEKIATHLSIKPIDFLMLLSSFDQGTSEQLKPLLLKAKLKHAERFPVMAKEWADSIDLRKKLLAAHIENLQIYKRTWADLRGFEVYMQNNMVFFKWQIDHPTYRMLFDVSMMRFTLAGYKLPSKTLDALNWQIDLENDKILLLQRELGELYRFHGIGENDEGGTPY